MNNLKELRMISNVSPKMLSRLLNVTVYTYLAYEQEKMNIPPELVKMISMIYDISEEIILSPLFEIDTSSIKELTNIASMSEEERFKVLCHRIINDNCNPSYRDIKKIKDDIRNSLKG